MRGFLPGKSNSAWAKAFEFIREDFTISYDLNLHKNSAYSILMKAGLVVYTKGSFRLSKSGKKLYAETKKKGETLSRGLPIQNKKLYTDIELIKSLNWQRIKILDKLCVSDESTLIVGGIHFVKGSSVMGPLELELRVSSILEDLSHGMAPPPTVIGYQRLDLFSPGVVWFKTESGLHTIQEIYFDVVFYYMDKFNHDPQLLWLDYPDVSYLIVKTDTMGSNQFEGGVVAIVADCKVDEVWTNVLDIESDMFVEIKE
jgi:hypothetical protein